jgi:hypothetical protein
LAADQGQKVAGDVVGADHGEEVVGDAL